MLSEKTKKRLLSFVADDLGEGDVTSRLIPEKRCRAKIIAKEETVLAGLEETAFLFESGGVKIKKASKDGARVKPGAVVIEIEGINRVILSRERMALNVLSRMSGVASECARAVEVAGGTTKIAVTRKTLPGFNEFDKKAARIGGALPHRLNLNEMILVKDNHTKFFANVSEAVKKARKAAEGGLYEVEVGNVKQAAEAARAGKGSRLRIMLDNFGVEEARKAIKAVRETDARIEIELSGGITLDNLWLYASLESDLVSMGCLTQAARSKNFSLEIME